LIDANDYKSRINKKKKKKINDVFITES